VGRARGALLTVPDPDHSPVPPSQRQPPRQHRPDRGTRPRCRQRVHSGVRHEFAARESAIFGQLEAGLGSIPGGGAVQHLTRLMGRGRALEVLLSAEDYDAGLAERYGWINRALLADALAEFVRSLAHRIAGFPAAGRVAIKDRVNAIGLAPVADFRRDSDLVADTQRSPETQDRIAAAQEHGFQTRAGTGPGPDAGRPGQRLSLRAQVGEEPGDGRVPRAPHRPVGSPSSRGESGRRHLGRGRDRRGGHSRSSRGSRCGAGSSTQLTQIAEVDRELLRAYQRSLGRRPAAAAGLSRRPAGSGTSSPCAPCSASPPARNGCPA
jgi:Enoyl-CoA hydratase/isomerase